jgi:hypothetical protein
MRLFVLRVDRRRGADSSDIFNIAPEQSCR